MRRWMFGVCLGAALVQGEWAAAAGGGVAKLLSREISATVEKIMPSVVVVRTEAVRYHRAYDLFFGREFAIPETLAGQGSGVIID